MAIIILSYQISVLYWIFYLHKDVENVAVKFAADNLLPLTILSFGFVVIYQYAGIYDSFRSKKLRDEFRQLMLAHFTGTGLVVGMMFILKIRDFSRGVAVSFLIVSVILLMTKRIILRQFLRSMRKKGYNQKFVLIIGDGNLAQKYTANIRSNPEFGLKCIGYVGRSGKNLGIKRLGGYEDLSLIIEKYSPDEIVIALESDAADNINDVIGTCEEMGVCTNIIPMYNDYLPACATIDVVGDVRLINIREVSLNIVFNSAVKRCFDILFSCAVIIITSPALIITALCVKLSGPGPVLFKQTRVGKDRKPFTMLKFRSMQVNDSSDTAWSTNRDSRVTPFGAFIRKFSIDELPQFFNVLRGEMSVVGPRPELPYYVEIYKHTVPHYMTKHQVKPGITGWAQVNGCRGDTSIEDRISYDIWYIENWSMLLDVKIILMTVFGGMVNSEENLRRRRAKKSK